MNARMLAAGSAVALLCAVPTAAQAAPPFEQGHDEGTFSDSFDDCGPTIDFVDTFSVHFVTREVAGSGGQAFLGHENVRFRTVYTNADTGEWFVIRGKFLFKEMTGTHVEGDIWEFTGMDVGQPFTVEDSDGNVVLRDRGRVAYRVLFDTLGDSTPGGMVLDFEVTRVNGPHPGLDVDFCTLVNDLIG